MHEFLEIVKPLGPTATIVAFFIWWSYRRENALIARLEEMEKYIRTELRELAERAITALNNQANTNAAIIEELRNYGRKAGKP